VVDNDREMPASRPRTAHAPRVFQQLYQRHYGFVWDAVRRFGVVPAQTDDAVQDTFVTAYRRFDELALPGARAWLYAIARRIASNYRRADERGTRKQDALAQTTEPPRTATPELAIALERFLEALTPADRELFVLSEIEGMSGPEAAEALALNLSTTYSRVQSLRRRFRVAMTDVDPRAAIDEAKRGRPGATAHGWALLLPKLGLAHAPKLAPWWSLTAIGNLATIAMPVAAVVTIGLGWASAPVAEPPRVRGEPAVTPPALANPAAGTVPAATVPAPAPEVLPVTPLVISTPVISTPGGPTGARSTELASLERHNALLRTAAERLRAGAADDAIATITAHAREFPESSLADARAVLRIEALCAVGKPAQARGEAKLFLAEHPDSMLRGRIARSCAKSVVDSSEPGHPSQ
jgi:RNA polymerase sigma-70 factor (ECF subfamily)